MQPDGADLEYVYLGPSRGASASPPVTPSRSPMYISSYSPAPGTGFIQDDTPPYAAVDDWSAAPHLVSPGVMGCRTSNTGSARGPRPKTAGRMPAALPYLPIPCKLKQQQFHSGARIPSHVIVSHASPTRKQFV